MDTQERISALRLEPHPEGGFYRESFRSTQRVTLGDGRVRSAGTAIFYLLPAGTFSAFHRIPACEVWHHYDGGGLLLHQLGVGTTRDMKSVVTGVFLPSWFSREMTLSEKINLWRGKFSSMRLLRNTAFATDLTQQVAELALPVYFFSGAHDYTCAYPLAKAYFEKIQAPVKGFYTFEQSAHTPLFEEPDKVLSILREDVLVGENNLADMK